MCTKIVCHLWIDKSDKKYAKFFLLVKNISFIGQKSGQLIEQLHTW